VKNIFYQSHTLYLRGLTGCGILGSVGHSRGDIKMGMIKPVKQYMPKRPKSAGYTVKSNNAHLKKIGGVLKGQRRNTQRKGVR
jgi:hypothetical protein